MITGSPQFWRGRLYVPVVSSEEDFAIDTHYECCRFRGSVVAFDAGRGRQIWKTYTISEVSHPTSKSKAGTQLWGPSGAGIWSAPTLDPKHNTIYVATGNSYSAPVANTSDAVLALNLNSGKLLWSRQLTAKDAYNSSCVWFYDHSQSNCPQERGSDFDFGSSPILFTFSKDQRALIASQKSGVVYALDPDHTGKILWQTRVGKGGPLGGIEWGSAADADKVYVAVSDTSWLANGDSDPASGGGIFALRLSTGDQVWHQPPSTACQNRKNCTPAQLAAVSGIPGIVFSGALDGHLQAYSTEDGHVVWDFDTVRDFPTVNGVPAHGGAINGPGPTIATGMLYVNSGYGKFGEMPGNVLLAFSVDGK
jgi:polyvinyl alcohol dehydrogenase (cytochrome)